MKTKDSRIQCTVYYMLNTTHARYSFSLYVKFTAHIYSVTVPYRILYCNTTAHHQACLLFCKHCVDYDLRPILIHIKITTSILKLRINYEGFVRGQAECQKFLSTKYFQIYLSKHVIPNISKLGCFYPMSIMIF